MILALDSRSNPEKPEKDFCFDMPRYPLSYISITNGLTSSMNVRKDSILSVAGSPNRSLLIFAQAAEFSTWVTYVELRNCSIFGVV